MQPRAAFQDDNLPKAPEGAGENRAPRAGADHARPGRGRKADPARGPGFAPLTKGHADAPMDRGRAGRFGRGRCGLGHHQRGCRARLARFLPRPCLCFLPRPRRCQRCLARLFALQRRQHFLQIIGAGERFLRARSLGPLGCAGFTFTQPGFSDFLIQGCGCLAELRLSRRHHGCFRGRDARAAFGFGIGQAQIFGLGADLAGHALQDQKPAQRFIRRGGLGEQGFRRPNCQAPHGGHHRRQSRGARGGFRKGARRGRFRELLTLFRSLNCAFGFLYPRRHGDALARKPAFLGSDCFSLTRRGFGGGAACGANAAGFFQRLTRRLRKGKAGQRQQEKRESDARLSQAGNALSWRRAGADQAKPANSAQYPPAAHPSWTPPAGRPSE